LRRIHDPIFHQDGRFRVFKQYAYTTVGT
jgi:hypothetical protein